MSDLKNQVEDSKLLEMILDAMRDEKEHEEWYRNEAYLDAATDFAKHPTERNRLRFAFTRGFMIAQGLVRDFVEYKINNPDYKDNISAFAMERYEADIELIDYWTCRDTKDSPDVAV